MTFDYGIREESDRVSVWSLKPMTGDPLDWLADHPTTRAAFRDIEHRRTIDATNPKRHPHGHEPGE